MKLDRVTITGADNSIDPLELYKLSQEFWFVEWGILVHRKTTTGSYNRFPNLEWIRTLGDLWVKSHSVESGHMPPNKMKLAAHLCGSMVNAFVEDGHYQLQPLLGDLRKMFDRIQINTHGILTEPCLLFKQIIMDLEGMESPLFILQYDQANREWNDQFLAQFINCFPLFDLSHGAGVLPEQWPKPIHRYCGYSGGLGPENLTEQLKKIEAVIGVEDETKALQLAKGVRHPDQVISLLQCRIWIDMETRVRSNDDQQFDLAKVRSCLEQAAPFVTRKR